MGVKLTYGSIIQSITLQDLLEVEFETHEEIVRFLDGRITKNLEVVFVVFGDPLDSQLILSTEEYPEVLITRDFKSAIEYKMYSDKKSVFEFPTYEGALQYLQGHFEESSKMYKDNPTYEGKLVSIHFYDFVDISEYNPDNNCPCTICNKISEDLAFLFIDSLPEKIGGRVVGEAIDQDVDYELEDVKRMFKQWVDDYGISIEQ